MAWTFVVGASAQSEFGDPSQVTYGWAHLHAFHRRLAAEEGFDLSSMQDFGGTRSWDDVDTPLRLVFDLDYLNGDHPMHAYGPLSNRLRAIHERWSTTTPPGDEASTRMQADQFRSLTKLLSLLDVCLARGERLRVR